MATNRARQIATVAALATGLTIAAAGCSSSTAGPAAAAAPAGTPTATSTSTTPASTPVAATTPPAAPAQGKLNGVPAACPAAANVMSYLHLSTLTVDGSDSSICPYLFKGDKSAPYVVITFNSAPGLTPAQLKSGLTAGQKNVKDVPGLADAAYSFTSDAGLALSFLSGTTVCSIATLVPTTTADEVALANSILG